MTAPRKKARTQPPRRGPNCRFSDVQVRRFRQLVAEKKTTGTDLAREHGVSRRAMYDLLNGDSYQWVTEGGSNEATSGPGSGPRRASRAGR